MYREPFERITAALLPACRNAYGTRLKALALFGCAARAFGDAERVFTAS